MSSCPKLATVSLAGCFGCHMALFDLDERLFELLTHYQVDRSPLTGTQQFRHRVDVGLVEGGCANEEHVQVLRDFRRNCNVLITVGDCAGMGGPLTLRNRVPLEECLEVASRAGPTECDPMLPRPLGRVVPCQVVVAVDQHVPGCPPWPESLWAALMMRSEGEP